MGLVALFSTSASGCSALVRGVIDRAWMASTENGTEGSSFYADQGRVYCVASLVNGSSQKTLEMTIEKIEEPTLAEPNDAGVQAPAANAIKTGDVVAATGRVTAPVGSYVPYSVAYGSVTEQGEPDPANPLAPGEYRCRIQLSDDDVTNVEFRILCPAKKITAGTACSTDRALCPSGGASQPKSAACTCVGGVWSC